MSDLGIGDRATSSLGWIFVTRQPIEELAGSVSLVSSRLQMVIGISAALITLLVLFFSRLLLLPLRRLTDTAIEIERGKLNTAIPRFPTDEIGRLALVLEGVVKKLLGRVGQLRSAVQVSRAIAQTLDINQMLFDVARTLGEQFGYPDVRVYLMDTPVNRLRLQAGFGDESDRLLRVGHRIPIDETTLIGRAVLLNEPLLGGGKQALRDAGLITENSELVVPVHAGGQSLGAIHMIAGRLQEIDPEDVDIIRLMVDQLGASIQNARLFEQSTAHLAEIEALNRRLTHQAWEEYMGEGGALRHTLDPEARWPETTDVLRKSEQIKAETYIDADGRSVLAAPLILRGEPVGALAVTRPGGETWSRDEILLIESIASRMTMIAEGIRLVEETTQRAEREHRVNEISANLLQRATSVETVLRSALNELGGALGSDRVSLRIGAAPVRDAHQIAAGGVEPADNGGESPTQSDEPSAQSDEADEPTADSNNGDRGMNDDN
jgi:GAF domain-containing protein